LVRYDEIVGKLTPFLKQSGYNPKTGVFRKLAVFFKAYSLLELDFMPLSGFTGANVKERLSSEICPYYTYSFLNSLCLSIFISFPSGNSLLGFLDDLPSLERKNNEPFLMPVTDKLKVR
jgi:peptide chain release factor subunit 3